MVSVNSCTYVSDNNKNFVGESNIVKDPIAIAERSQKIKGMSQQRGSLDAPQTIGSTRGTNMQFNIDDQEVN